MSKLENSQPPSRADETGNLSPSAVGEQLQRILSSARFAESPRLSAFLRYVVEAKLAHQEDQIQEYTIGVSVFDRGESFDPRIDSIVRVEARRLRDRLGAYYAADGKDDPVAIDLPLGGYRPRFSDNLIRQPHARSYMERLAPALRRLLHNATLAWAIALGAFIACAYLLLRAPPTPGADTIALSLAAPHGGVLLTPARGGGPVVSPDGEKVVFAARDENGEVSLYLRSMDRVDAIRLAGTENGKWPFWSPDRNRIGFGALGKLKFLDLQRDEVRTVADAPHYIGGAWSDVDGGVILCSRYGSALSWVPEAGGTLQAVLPLEQDEREQSQPLFLPDGRRVLYTSSRRGRGDAVCVAAIGSGESRTLLEDVSTAKYAQTSDGRDFLLFSESGTLAARQVDPQTLEFLSPAVSLAGGLPPVGIGTFSAAASTLAYFHGPFPVSTSQLVWRSRTGQRLGTLGKPDNYLWIRFSPDEQTVAAPISYNQADVWTIDVATGVSTRQTDHPKLDRAPVWSPDGRQMLISTNRDGDIGRIYVLAADGSGKAEPWLDYPKDGAFSDWPSHWHPASSTVLFQRAGEGGADIWVKDPGAPPHMLIGGSGSQINARLSPDQQLIAYASNELGEWQIFLSDYPPTGSRIRVSPDGGNHPLWNANGRELFYAAPDGAVMAVEISAKPALKASLPDTLFRVRFPVTPAPIVYQYDVTNDGERFLTIEEIEGPSATAILHWERLLDR